MKTILLALLIFPFALFSQQAKISVKSQLDIVFIKNNTPQIMKGNQTIIRELPIMQINGQTYVSFIGKIRSSENLASTIDGVIIGEGVGNIRSLRIRLDKLESVFNLSQFEYIELAGKIQPYLDKVNYDTRADSVHAGYSLPQSYTGKNVLIGVTDWGFDYTHPMFYDTLLQNTRILAAWDQFKKSGPAPSGYNYGAEYATVSELMAAQTDTSNQLSHSTHATHVSGIAGGSGAGVIAKGMAFESEFLFTTLLVDEAAVLDAWNWMYTKSQQQSKNLVVNMSWGLYHFGTNDGTSLLSQAIDNFTDLGVLFVSSAGNNGDVNFHFQREFNNDSIKSKVKFYDYALHDSLWGQSIHGWGEIGKNFEVKIQILSLSNNLLAETPYYPTSMNGYDQGFLELNATDTVWYNVAAQSAHPQNSKPTVRFRVKDTHTNTQVVLVVKANDGIIHFWNLVELTTNGGNWGQPFLSLGAGYISGDTQYGIGEPTCADACLSVASHVPSFLHSSGNVLGGSRSSFSSIGPRNDGVLKPEISGPGSSILSSISSFTDDSYTATTSTTFQSKNYDFGKLSGTSMSSPAVAGICALVWEANPYLSPRQVKNIIIETARQDQYTGVIPPTGDVKWGYGKVNALAAVKMALTVVGLKEIKNDFQHEWNVYPNPTSSSITLSGLENIQSVKLITIAGKEILLDASANKWNVENFSPGIYVFRVIANNRVYQKKIVIE